MYTRCGPASIAKWSKAFPPIAYIKKVYQSVFILDTFGQYIEAVGLCLDVRLQHQMSNIVRFLS